MDSSTAITSSIDKLKRLLIKSQDEFSNALAYRFLLDVAQDFDGIDPEKTQFLIGLYLRETECHLNNLASCLSEASELLTGGQAT